MSTDLLEPTTPTCEVEDAASPSTGWHFPVPEDFSLFFPTENKSRQWEPGTYFRIKYALDRILGYLMLIAAAPIIAACWCIVRFTSPGPGFYRQTRVGLGGRTFKIVKLRTMRVDAETDGPVWSHGKGDVRITPVGRLMRALHLDELPQLWNVARGEMSLVGPRPERPEIIACLEQLIPGYHLRHNIKPGVTGLSQINLEPDSNINVTRRKQILDLRYVGNASIWLDCRMLFATLLRMFGIKGARIIRIVGLEQHITQSELQTMNYEFDVPESELWNPGKPLPR